MFVHSRSKYLDCFQKHCFSQLTFQLQRHFSLYIKVLKMSRTISPYGWNQIVIIPHSLCTYGPSFVTINTVKVSLPSLKALQTKPTFACSFSFSPPSPDLSDATQPRCVPLRCGDEEKDPARRACAATRAAVSVCGRADSPQQTQVCCEHCSLHERQQNVSVPNICNSNTTEIFTHKLATKTSQELEMLTLPE